MNSTISKKIKTLRLDKGINQEQMADLLHISQSAYSRIEIGECDGWRYIDDICTVFEIKPEELFIPEGLVQNNNSGDNASAVQNNTHNDTHTLLLINFPTKL
ncbi:MAG: helix-turn-helix domain-containing protein [Prevotellaceae bacterium]|jgi:transcriptional regulator with XRE-family HTH domain|nr:helix-turn-helix domain-containing protein [Prevotellaceae bacterium]